MDMRALLREPSCQRMLSHGNSTRQLELLRLQIQAQGMLLRLHGCPVLAQGHAPAVAVSVEVANSEVASRFVRGPLADGEAVDMGSTLLGSENGEEEYSPDVYDNRQWLAQLMGHYGFAPVQGYWWAFRLQTDK